MTLAVTVVCQDGVVVAADSRTTLANHREAWEVTLPDRSVEPIATTANGGGAAWRGQSDVVTRIVRGTDLELLERLAAAHGLTDEIDRREGPGRPPDQKRTTRLSCPPATAAVGCSSRVT